GPAAALARGRRPAGAWAPCRRRRPSGRRPTRRRATGRPSGGSYGVEVSELKIDPLADVVRPNVLADRLGSPPPLGRFARERRMQGVGLTGAVDGIQGERPLAQLLGP